MEVESLFITAEIDAHKNINIATMQIAGSYLHVYVYEEVITGLQGPLMPQNTDINLELTTNFT